MGLLTVNNSSVYSQFTPSNNYQLDSFIEFQNIQSDQYPEIAELQSLLQNQSKSPTDISRMNSLLTKYRAYMPTVEDWNKFCACLLNMENFIKTEVQDYVTTKQNEMTTLVTNKSNLFQSEIDKFNDKGVFSPTTQYYAKNYVVYDDGTGDNIYICKQDCLGVLPTNTVFFRRLGIRGSTGQKGQDGINFSFKGAWNSTTTYGLDNCVQYQGCLFSSKIANNIGNTPDINSDTSAWGKALDVTVTVAKLNGQRSIASSSADVNFFTGTINVFNPNTDILEVFKNTTALTEGVHYTINSDNKSIHCVNGIWESGSFFDFRVTRNQINNLVFGDANSIQNGTINLNKLATDVQTQINKVGTSTLKTTARNLSDAINENANKIDILNTKTDEYKYAVVTVDANNKPTHSAYKRKSDDTLYKDVICSNADANGYYQTIVEKTYGANGTTLLETKTYTLTYNADGVIMSKDWTVS